MMNMMRMKKMMTMCAELKKTESGMNSGIEAL